MPEQVSTKPPQANQPSREPSGAQVASQIALLLGAEEATSRLRQIAWDLGRTQAQAEQIVEGAKSVTLLMRTVAKRASFPAGLPLPTKEEGGTATCYRVFVAAKQWKKVAVAATASKEVLLIEGFLTLDQQEGMITIFASKVNTRAMLRAAKQSEESTQGATG